MPADGSDEPDDQFVAEYENATAADIIEEAEPNAAAEERVGPDTGSTADAGDETTDPEAESDGSGGNVAGSFTPDTEVRPQLPTRENTLFVAFGVYLTLLASAETAVGLDLATAAGAFVAVAVVTGLCYGALVVTAPDT